MNMVVANAAAYIWCLDICRCHGDIRQLVSSNVILSYLCVYDEIFRNRSLPMRQYSGVTTCNILVVSMTVATVH